MTYDFIDDYVGLVRKERLELSRVTPLAPKASASTNSATFAFQVRLDTRTICPAGHYTVTKFPNGTIAAVGAVPDRDPVGAVPDRDLCQG